jgi:uncharacterized protein YcbX
MTMRLEYIYRYPVKGMRAERMQSATLMAGAGITFDRAYAFTSGNQPPPPDDSTWTPARSFIQMTVYPQMAGFSASVNTADNELTITSPDDATASAGLDGGSDGAVNALMNHHFKAGPEAPIALHRLQQARGHWDFTDTGLSIVNLATVEWLEWVSGLTLSHLRFRANLYITGLQAFDEFALAGQTLRIGSTKLRILRPAMRCAATAADPWSGDTSIDVVDLLRSYTGHAFCGMYAQVAEGGDIYEDDHLRPVPDAPAFDPTHVLPERTPDPLIWPRPAIATRTGNATIEFRPAGDNWLFLPASAGARLMLHPGLDYSREPVRLSLVERGQRDFISVSAEHLDEVPDSGRVLISGPIERTSGRA